MITLMVHSSGKLPASQVVTLCLSRGCDRRTTGITRFIRNVALQPGHLHNEKLQAIAAVLQKCIGATVVSEAESLRAARAAKA